jgi:desulfoferrodoxin (superoxide reductase-like protein)
MNNMAENGIKVSQIAKDLKVTGKDIVERLAEFGVEVKGTSVLTDEQLGLVFDIFTSLYDMGDEPIVKPPLETEEIDDNHTITIENVEDEKFVTVNHPMTKTHYISFIAYVTSDKVNFVKLYPEGNAETRIQFRGRGYLYIYCNKHGLMKKRV